MTKSIIELIHEAKAYPIYTTHSAATERFAAAIKAAHLAELTQGVEMPEPVAYRATNWGHDDAAFVYRDADEPFLNIKSDGLVTLDQCREAVAAAVARKDAEIARLETNLKSWVRANSPNGWIDDLRVERDDLRERADYYQGDRDALTAERDALAKKVEVLREALNDIASWGEGPEVNGSFDEPDSAEMERKALEVTK